MRKWVLLFLLVFAVNPSFAVSVPDPVYIDGISSTTVHQINTSTWTIIVSPSSFVPVNIIFPDSLGQLVSFFMGAFLCFVFILGIKSA